MFGLFFTRANVFKVLLLKPKLISNIKDLVLLQFALCLTHSEGYDMLSPSLTSESDGR